MPALACLALVCLALAGCSGHSKSSVSSKRLADLDARVTVLTDETLALEDRTQGLPAQVHMLQAALEKLDRTIWERQSKLTGDLALLKEEVIPVLTNRLETLGRTLAQMHEEVDNVRAQVASARSAMRYVATERTSAAPADAGPPENLETRLVLLEEGLNAVRHLLERAEHAQEQAFAAETAWLASLAYQMERARHQPARPPAAPRPDSDSRP